MSDISLRRVPFADIASVSHKLVSYAFRSTPPLPDLADVQREFAYYEDATMYAAFEADTPIASASSSPMQINIRDRLYQAGGVWAVSTLPTARRKGVARDLVARLFRHLYEEEGAAFTALYAFRESFYTRLGYIMFPQAHTVRFPPDPLQPLLKQTFSGQVEMLSMQEGYDLYDAYMRKQQQKTHGMGLFSPKTNSWMRDKNSHWLAVARNGGEPIGMMLYKLQDGVMKVHTFFYDTSEGLYLLLEWIARHIDHAKEVEMRIQPAVLPETWWTDLYVKRSFNEPALARVLAVSRLDGMAVGTGSFTARIHDPYCLWNEGVYQFASVEGKLQVTTATEAECDMSIQGLTALVLGAHDPETFPFRDWGNPSPTTQQAMRVLFSPALPYHYITY